MQFRICLLCAVVLVSGACTGSTGDSPTTSLDDTGSSPGSTTTFPMPTVDLGERPQVWFGPQPPLGADEFGRNRTGPEFYDLFEPNAPWQDASESVHVLHFFGEWVAWRSSDAELASVVTDLNRRAIAIAYEGGPLTPIEGCSENIEGFAGVDEAKVIVNRVATAGGRITYMDLEHPFDAVAELPAGCELTLVDAARDMKTYIETVRAVFPDIEFGLIETGKLDPSTIASYLDAYMEAIGEYPTHLMLDVGYDEPGWPISALEIERLVHERGIDFAIFYLGFEHDQSDREWLDHVKRRVVEYEVLYGGQPDRPIFESWHPYPQRLLPDTDPSSFTEVLNWYDRTRTELGVEVESASDLGISGRLTDASGEPLAGRTVEILVEAGDPTSTGVAQEYLITGVSPDDATRVDVGYRINEECDCRGTAELMLESFEYAEAGGLNLVVNPDFSSQIEGWGVYGAETQVVTPEGLHVVVTPDEVAGATSQQFPITPGTPFTATIRARVSPQSDGSGHFFVIFHNDGGAIRRIRQHIRPSRQSIGTALTDSEGRYQVTVAAPEFPWTIGAWFEGDDDYWPAFARAAAP